MVSAFGSIGEPIDVINPWIEWKANPRLKRYDFAEPWSRSPRLVQLELLRVRWSAEILNAFAKLTYIAKRVCLSARVCGIPEERPGLLGILVSDPFAQSDWLGWGWLAQSWALPLSGYNTGRTELRGFYNAEGVTTHVSN